MFRHRFKISRLLILAFTFATASAQSNAMPVATFDFEDVQIPSGNLIVFNTPQLISSNGIGMTVSRESGASFAVNIRTGERFVDQFDTRALSTFTGDGGVGTTDAILLDFDRLASNVTVEIGDFGGDADALLVEAFSGPSGSGTLLDLENGFLAADPNQFFSFDTLSVAAPNIQSVRLSGVGLNGNVNLFFDNIVVVSAVPEPTSFGLLALGCGWLTIRRRKRFSF